MRQPTLLLVLLAGCVYGAGLPAEVIAELLAGSTVPAADYQLVQAWECEEPGNHQTGARVEDRDASAGAAWEARPGAGPSDRCAVFGPYLELEPGHYLALFRLQLPEPSDDDVVARLDAVVGYGQKTLAVRELFAGDLAPGRYQLVPLTFAYPGGKLECRVFWTGAAPLRIDRIALYAAAGEVDFSPNLAPQPRSIGQPRDLPYAGPPPSYDALFPRAEPPARTLIVADLRDVAADLRAALLALQGLVNRSRPSLWCHVGEVDEHWLDWMRRRGYVEAVETVEDPMTLFTRYADRIKGLIVSDARLPASKNVAYMLAALHDGLPASPRVAAQLGLPVLEDLHGRWKTNAEAYRWAFDTLWPKLNHQTIACLWPDDTSGLRDYTVQQRIFTFWLGGRIDGARPGGSSQADLETMEAIFASMPTNIPVLGYPWAGVDIGIGEHDGVQSFARYAKYLVGSTGCTNLSVMSGYPMPELRQSRPPAPALEEGKVYVTWVMSDGDNLPVLSRGNFPQLWQQPQRGQIPIAWSLSPSAALLMPPVVDYYYQTATINDGFVGAVSGIGYTYPQDYAERFKPAARQRLFDEFLELTRVGMERSDERQIWIMGVDPGPLIRRYAERIPELDALFPDYGRRIRGYEQAFYPTARGVPVFHAVTGWAEDDDHDGKIERALEQVRSVTPPEGTAFLHLFIWNWGADLSVYPEVMRRLGPRYVAVRPDHLAELAARWLAQQKLLVRAPRRLVALGGRTAACRLELTNATAEPLECAATAASGLDDAVFTPARAILPPFESADLLLTGRPRGDTVTVLVSGPFGRTERRIDLVVVPATELLEDPPAEPLEFVDRFAAVGLPHRSGASQADPEAWDGAAWAAVAGETAPGHIVFGPYRPTEPGRYVAVFRVKRTGDGEGTLARLDAHVGGATDDLAGRDLAVGKLPLGAYRCIPLVFDHPGGALETRVFWPGHASLAVDEILLFRIEGAPPGLQ